jgi:hypothetical protein
LKPFPATISLKFEDSEKAAFVQPSAVEYAVYEIPIQGVFIFLSGAREFDMRL